MIHYNAMTYLVQRTVIQISGLEPITGITAKEIYQNVPIQHYHTQILRSVP